MAGNRIIALATDRNVFSYIDDRLTVIKSGTMIGETKNDSFIPAHDLAMSVKQKEGAWPVYDADYDEAVAFIRLEQFRIEGMPRGRDTHPLPWCTTGIRKQSREPYQQRIPSGVAYADGATA